MKKRIHKIVVAICLISTSVFADGSLFKDTRSIVGLEGGYSSLSVDRTLGSQSALEKYNAGHLGFKIGAQNDQFRVFVGGRYYSASDFDYLTTIGIEVQYLLEISQSTNLYFGVGTGVSKMRFVAENEAPRVLDDTYISGDIGINIHLKDSLDLELGARYIGLDATNTIANVTYTFDDLITGYIGIIYKFKP